MFVKEGDQPGSYLAKQCYLQCLSRLKVKVIGSCSI